MRYVLSRFALIAFLLACGCGKHKTESPTPQNTKKETGVPVVGKAEMKSLRRVIEEPATVLAIEETPLYARIPGFLVKVNADIGDRVKGPTFDAKGKCLEQGQILAKLGVPEMVEELRQKTALVKQADAEVDQAKASVKAADAHVETAGAMVKEAEAARARAQAVFARWESEYKRVSGLVQRGVIDEQTRDETENQFKASSASRQEVEAHVLSAKAMEKESVAKSNKAKADLDAAIARVEVAKAEEGRMKALTEYMMIRAPFDGVVTRRNVHTGHLLSGNGTTPLFVLSRMDVVRVVVEVSEADALAINEKTPVRIRFQVIKDREFKVTVKRVSWSFDQKARTLRAEIDLPNPDGMFRPGMYAYVAFDTDTPKAYTLPLSALLSSGGETNCFRVEEGKAVRTPLKVGVRDKERVQALQKQVKNKDGEGFHWEDINGEEDFVLEHPGTLTEGQTISPAKK